MLAVALGDTLLMTDTGIIQSPVGVGLYLRQFPSDSEQHCFLNPCQLHWEPPGDIPSKYCLGTKLLNFLYRMGTGVANIGRSADWDEAQYKVRFMPFSEM